MIGGLYHNNYRFWLTGDEWNDSPMLLRLTIHENSGRSRKGGVDFTLREVEPLNALKRIGFKYETPEFICMVKGELE